MYIFFTGLVAAPVIQIASIGTQITEAFAGLDRIREIMQTPTEDAEDASRGALDDVRGDVAFEDVWFEYNAGVPVLKDVSFDAPAGSTTALVGSSGSGKSTLISLVMAFNRPTAGAIRIDGRDLDDAAAARLPRAPRRRAAGQLPLRRHDRREHPLRQPARDDGRGAATRRASRTATSSSSGFAEKYDTVVGERGVKLSGGQRQRVAIARAILADPRILILDEATSSLDSESEAKIQDGAAHAAPRPHDVRHRAPAVDHPQRRPDPRDRERARSSSAARTPSCCALGGRYQQLHDRQYAFEQRSLHQPGRGPGRARPRPKLPPLPVGRPCTATP